MAAEVGDAAGDAVGLGGEDEEQWLYGDEDATDKAEGEPATVG